MKSLLVLPFLVVSISVVCHTLPQNDIAEDIAAKHGPQINKSEAHRLVEPKQGCQIKYVTKFQIQEVENVRTECSEWIETKCTTKSRPKCTHRHVDKCETKYKETCRHWSEKTCIDNWRNVCETRYKEACNDIERTVQVPYEEDECTTRQERRCEKHWEETVKGKKVWVDNPATCKFYDTTDCQPKTKYHTEIKTERECNQVPYQHCNRVRDTKCNDIPRTECKDVPYQDCKEVRIETCEQESWEDCQKFPRTKCTDIHEKIPKQVAIQVPVRDCHYHDARQAPKVDVSDADIVEGYANIVEGSGSETVDQVDGIFFQDDDYLDLEDDSHNDIIA